MAAQDRTGAEHGADVASVPRLAVEVALGVMSRMTAPRPIPVGNGQQPAHAPPLALKFAAEQ